MAMRQIFNEIRGMKVKDVPAHVKPLATMSNLRTSIQRTLDNYHAKYIQTDSIQPLYHLCFGGIIFSYLVALPEERRHLEHQQHIKEHGGHWDPRLVLSLIARFFFNLLLFIHMFHWFSITLSLDIILFHLHKIRT